MTTTAIERELAAARYVGETLHMILWRRGMTKYRAAEAIGVSASTFSKKLRGAVPITVDELMALAQLLEVEPGQLLPPVEYAIRDSNPEPADMEPDRSVASRQTRRQLSLIWGLGA